MSRLLTHGPIGRALLRFALPLWGGYVLQSLNTSVNAFWIGRHLGEAALSAAVHANNLLFVLIALVFGISQATNLLVAQAVGAGDWALARRTTGTSACLFLGAALLMAAQGWPLAAPLLHAMGAEAATAALAVDYLRVLFLALPPMLLLIFVAAVLRGTGDSRTPFIALLAVALGDVALNPLFIFGAGPLPAWGMAGSALATLVANSLGLAGLLAWLRWRRVPLWHGWRQGHRLWPDPALVRCLVTKGLPMGLQMLLVALSLVLMLGLVNAHGAQASAAYSAALQLWTYVQMPAIAVASACTTIAAQNVGAGHWPRVARTARAGIACHLLLTGACVALVLAFDRPVLALFLPDGSAALEPARHLNRIVLGSFVLLGISGVLAGVVRATGAVLVPLAILAVALWGVRLPLAWGLQPLWGLEALWWSFPLSALASLLLSLAYYRWGHWRQTRLLGSAPPVP
ncbi:MATE family efflux transporter [Comamonas aquatica]|uniref:MATE family efflux transporter n=1 Tax=Comamonas aquatica TaxID=225991 RepID=A0AA42HW01_9BURK|nr:MATE family efflux transporter [Comamonas aquatica]MDH0363966.1 MATE family efflux transporter [Comamonas aquatica]